MEGAKLFGLLTGRDVLPLQELVLSNNKNLGDEGVAYLIQGLQGCSKIRLHSLCLNSFLMGDAGLKSLAEAIGSGRFWSAKKLMSMVMPPFATLFLFLAR